MEEPYGPKGRHYPVINLIGWQGSQAERFMRSALSIYL